jgi:hypothetical protein
MTLKFIEIEKEDFLNDITSTEMRVFLDGEPLNSLPLKRRLTLIPLNNLKEFYDFNLNLVRYRNIKENLIDEIGMLTPNDLPDKLVLKITYDTEFLKNRILTSISSTPDNIICEIRFFHKMDEWANPFTVKELNQYLAENYVSTDSTLGKVGTLFCSLLFNVSKGDTEACLKNLIFDASEKFLSFYYQSINELNEKNSESLFVKLFDFPPEYKNICSQYLMWFGEFLKNLGIDADVSTENKDGKTSLIVSPAENGEMLEQIEQLFYCYIDLPYTESIPYNPDNFNIHQKYKMESLLDEVGELQHKLKRAMRQQNLLEAENDSLLEDKVNNKSKIKTLEKDTLLLKSCLKDPKKTEIFSCLNKKFSLVGSVDNKNDLTVGLGFEIKPKGLFKEMFNKSDSSKNKSNDSEEGESE